MRETLASGSEVLQANRALREWAAGLRHWSGTVREASSAQRERAHALKSGRQSRDTLRPSVRRVHQPRVKDDLPVLGVVRVAELSALLIDHHGFGAVEAQRALSLGLLVAGYPPDFEEIGAADVFDVVEVALGR